MDTSVVPSSTLALQGSGGSPGWRPPKRRLLNSKPCSFVAKRVQGLRSTNSGISLPTTGHQLGKGVTEPLHEAFQLLSSLLGRPQGYETGLA